MGRDESGTVARLKQNRAERLDPILAKYGGRLVKLTGDGALVEFTSAVDALSAIIEFQQTIVEANRGQSPDTALVFRMGLHLGDLIVDGDDLYGDGVNVAARLEMLAEPGGICVSGAVRDQVGHRLDDIVFAQFGVATVKDGQLPAGMISMLETIPGQLAAATGGTIAKNESGVFQGHPARIFELTTPDGRRLFTGTSGAASEIDGLPR